MNSERFKPMLVRDKIFLEELYSSSTPQARQIVKTVSDSKLNTLIQLLHFITKGEIKIRKEDFAAMPKRIVVILRKQVESSKSTKALLNSEREVKVKFLCKLAPYFPHITYTLFNET